MKYLLRLILIVFFICNLANADSYKLQLSRSDQDIYMDKLNSVVVLTQNCFHYGFSENSILIYQAYSYDNKVIFPNGDVCKVKEAYKN